MGSRGVTRQITNGPLEPGRDQTSWVTLRDNGPHDVGVDEVTFDLKSESERRFKQGNITEGVTMREYQIIKEKRFFNFCRND